MKTSSDRIERLALTGVFALVAGAVVWLSLSLSPPARVGPMLVGVGTLALIGVIGIGELKGQRGKETEGQSKELSLLSWLLLLFVLVLAIGVPAAAPLWLLLFLRFVSKEPWRVALTFGIGLAIPLYGVLVFALGLPAFGNR